MMIDVYQYADGDVIALQLLLRDISAHKKTAVDVSPSDHSVFMISSRQCRSICVYYVYNFPTCAVD